VVVETIVEMIVIVFRFLGGAHSSRFVGKILPIATSTNAQITIDLAYFFHYSAVSFSVVPTSSAADSTTKATTITN
jgi:hypothetical protein